MARYTPPFAAEGSHAVDANGAKKLLDVALARGGSYADLYFEHVVSGSYNFQDGALGVSGRAVSTGVGVRVLHGEATGYAYTEAFEPEAITRAARTASAIASGGPGQVAPQFVSLPSTDRYPVSRHSVDLPGAEKLALFERADAWARSRDPRIKNVSISLTEELSEVLVVTSDGRFVSDRRPMLGFVVRVLAQEDGGWYRSCFGGGGRVGIGYFERRSPEEHAERALRTALTMLEAQETPTGKMDVVLAGGDGCIVLQQAIGHSLEADVRHRGIGTRLGWRIAGSHCTLIDDATIAHARGTLNVDDEGNLPGRTVLIEDGFVRGYVHDRRTASVFGVSATGNGRRESFKAHPMPRMTNMVLLPGTYEPEEIVRSVRYGLYARSLANGSVDLTSGDFRIGVDECYLIERGRIVAPVSGAVLEGNGAELLSGIQMIGNDVRLSDAHWKSSKFEQEVPVGCASPTIKVTSLHVARGPL